MKNEEPRELQDPNGGVVAVRFSGEEFRRLSRQTDEAGQALAGFIHAAVREQLARQPVGRTRAAPPYPSVRRRKASPSTAIASWESARGRQIEAAVAIVSFSAVKDSITTGPA